MLNFLYGVKLKMKVDKLKIGVVGLGKMGIMHTCLLNVLPNAKVSAIFDKSQLMRLMAKRAIHEALITDQLEKFSSLELDGIFVLTPIPSHYSIIKEIYAKRLSRNVFVEKTLSSSFEKSEELCKLSESSAGVNMVGYMKRFAVTFNQAKELLNQEVLGDIISFSANAFSSDFADAEKGSIVSRGRGGVLDDLGSHVIDLAIWFFGGLNVTSAKANLQLAADSEDVVTFSVSGLNDLAGVFEISWCKKGYRMPEFELSIRGAKGNLSVNDDEVRLDLGGSSPRRWYKQDLNDSVSFLLGGSEYYREDKHFVDSLAIGQSSASDFRSALQVDFLIKQVRDKIRND